MAPKTDMNKVYRTFTILENRLASTASAIGAYNNATNDEVFLNYHKNALAGINEMYGELVDQLQNEPEDSQFQKNLVKITEFDRTYGIVSIRIDTLLKAYEVLVPPPPPPPNPQSKSRLPPLSIPTFSGKVNDWVFFKEEFSKLIGQSTVLDDFEKHIYLRNALQQGEAKDVQTMNDTYASLWEALTKKYDVRRIIVDSHIGELFSLPAMTKECPQQLELLIGNVQKNVRVLEALNLEQQFIIAIVTSRLDPETKKAYEMRLKQNELPDYDDMFEFLQGRCQTLKSLANKITSINKPAGSRPFPKYSAGNQKDQRLERTTVLHTSEKRKYECSLCEKPHFITQCRDFLQLTPQERLNNAQRLRLCCNCLSSRHTTKDCTSTNCKICNKKHNTILHLDLSNNPPTPTCSGGDNGGDGSKRTALTSVFGSKKEILLGSAVVLVYDAYGQPNLCRALLDSCSQPNIMTEECAQLLRLKKIPINSTVFGIEGKASGIKSRLTAKIQSRFTNYSIDLEFVVMSKITGHQPDFQFDTKGWNIPANKQLADPDFDKPQKVDLILGAEIFYDILTGKLIKLAKNAPNLCETKLGWIVGGKMLQMSNQQKATTPEFCGCVTIDTTLNDQVKRFWEIENCRSSKVLSVHEREVEKHFAETHRRQPDGRYVVALPVKESVNDLGDSEKAAKRRFLNLERRLNRDPDLKQQYAAFMAEYRQLGHMKLSNNKQIQPTYFLPHHAVLRPESSTTKLRVVFDGSAKSSTGLSLNDVIKVGANVQQELFEILIRFRRHQIAFTADIGKMYRQVLVSEQHQPLQQIYWRDDPNQELIAYSLTTVTYETASAPFLATRTLQQLAEDEQQSYPVAAPIAKTDFYVDDVLSGADSIEDSLELQNQLIKLLSLGGFELHKWCSSDPRMMSSIPMEKQEKKLQFSDSQTVKALGITWQPYRDVFTITTTINTEERETTKRSVLSDIARLFDPLGLAGPVIVTAKILLQRLWQKQTDWDEPLDLDEKRDWNLFREELQTLRHVEVPRCVLPFTSRRSVILHGFCDASTSAYGACVYVQCVDSGGNQKTTLLCSKSRVAPLKTITVPRLELCSAQLLTQLVTKVKGALNIEFSKTVLWTDSTIVLAWISSPSSNLKTFVAHRIAEIQESSNPRDWRHIPTEHNPADIVSRGLQPSQLKNSTLWWCGPSFLTKPENQWPVRIIRVDKTTMPEMKTCILVQTTQPLPVLTKFSSFWRLQRVMAYVLRFVTNCRVRKEERHGKHLTATEMSTSQTAIFLLVQTEGFSSEKKCLTTNKPISKDSPLSNLNVFLDNNHLIRVGGRIRHSNQNFDVKHQIVLPKRHHVTRILIRELHQQNGHVGQQGLLSIVRQNYWPINAKDVIKSVTNNCVLCFKRKPKSTNQAMGDLPSVRTTACHPFINVGVDYAGPLQLKVTRRTTSKAYVAIFVCMATKAVHIELVSDLSSKAFIGALDRFTSRRGNCQNIYSDNGTNFVGAKTELKLIYDFLSNPNTQEWIATSCATNKITFHFVPPRAPHFGGLWEAAVKSTKYHLNRIVGPLKLSFEEMAIVLAKIEAILNSRPLVPESSDPEDVTALTPGHFLIGRPLVAMIEPRFIDLPSNRLNRWQILQKATQHFWQRWNKEYLTTLQQRSRIYKQVDVRVGMLVVVKEDNTPVNHWILGRVTRVMPGKDNIVRAVTLKTKNGTLDRPVVKICILPNQNDSVPE